MSTSDNTHDTVELAAASEEALTTLRPPPDPSRIKELDEAAAKFEAQKRWQDLIRTLQQRVEIMSVPAERVQVLERIAGIYLERFSNQAEALKTNEAILEIEPENARAIEFLKSMYEKRKDWDKLLRILRKEAASAHPNAQLEQYTHLARFVTEKVKRPEVSTELWEEVHKRDPENSEAIGQLAGLYEKSKDYAKLAAVLRTQAAQTADTAQRVNTLVKLGLIAGDRLNDDALAVEAWRGVLALDPNDRRAQEALKKRYLAMHAWDELEGFYEESGRWDELIRVLEREVESPSVETPVRISLLHKIAQLWEVRKEKVDRAAKYLEKVLEIAPDNREAALRLIPIYGASKDARHLASVLEVKLLGDAPGADRVETLRQLGALYEQQLKDGDRAFERFRDAFLSEPEDPRSVEDLERAAAMTDRWRDVVATVERVLGGDTLDAVSQVALRLRVGGVLSTRLGDVAGAAQQYRTVLEQDPTNADALASLEGLLRGNGQWGELLGVLERRLEIADEAEQRRAVLFDIVQVAESQLGDLAKATEAAGTIVTEFGDDPEGLAALDRLYEKQSQWPALAAVLRRELEVHQNLGDDARALEVKFRLATTLEAHLGQAGEAVELHREILSAVPEHDGARVALERLLRDPEHRREAARILQPVYELRADWEALVRALEILVVDEEQHGDRVELLRRIGQVHETLLEDPRRALDAYGRAFREDPANPDIVETLTSVAGKVDGWRDVVALFREAAQAHQTDALGRELYIRIAEIEARHLGNVPQAVEALEAILAVDPTDLGALQALDQTYRVAGRWNDALSTQRRQLEIISDPDQYDRVLVEIATLQDERLQSPDAAIATYREMLDRDPANQTALEALDRMFVRLERWNDVAENLKVRLSLTDDPAEQTALQLRLAGVYDERLGNRAAAIDIHRQILEREPTNEDAVAALERRIEEPGLTAEIVSIVEPVYRQRGAYDRLVHAYETQARNTADPVQKVDLLHHSAEIQEAALDDARGAFDTLARALAEDPSREDTLNALDRLAQTLGADKSLLDVLHERIAQTETVETRVLLHRRASVLAEERLGDLEGAIGHEVAVLRQDPNNLDAVTSLERLYQLSDKAPELAEVLWRKAEILEDVEERKAYLWRAAELYETVLNDTASAVRAYRRVLEIDDGEVQALDALIRIFVAGERWPELLEAYEKKADLVTDAEEKKRLYYEVASVYETELKDGARAVDAYNRVLELDPTDLVAIQRLDHLYSTQGKWQELLSILEREAELAADPQEVASYRFRVAKLYETQLENIPRAIELYRDILEVIPDHAPSVDALSAILHGEREPLAAAAVLEPLFTASGAFDRVVEVLEVEVRHSDDAARRLELLQRIAEISETVLEKPEAAFQAYARAVSIDPRIEENLGNFERFGEGLDQWAQVATTYDQAVSTLADEPEQQVALVLRVGQIYEVQLGNAEEAIARYRKVLEIDPANSSALRSLDRLYEALERWAEMAEVLRREVALEDISPDEGVELRFRLGQVLEQRLGDLDGALAVYREILDVAADHAPTVAALESLVQRDHRRAEIAALLDPIYRMGEDWEKLASLQSRNLDLITDPEERVVAIRAIAEIVEEKLGDAVGAFGWLGRAVRERPLDERSLSEIERLGEGTGSWAELTNIYADVVEAEDASAEVRTVIGKRLARVHEVELQDLASAEGAYQFVLDVTPMDPEALEALDRLYSASGDAEKLVPILERRAQITQDPEERTEHTFRLARLLQEELNRPDDAVVQYRVIVEQINGRHRPSLDALEQIYTAAERWPELYTVYLRKLEVADTEEERADFYAHMARLAEGPLHQPDEAVKLYEQVLQIRGEEPATLAAMAALHERAGRWNELIEVLERQLSSEDDPDRRVGIALKIPAVYLERLDDRDRAIEGYRRALDLDAGCFDALRALAAIYRSGQQWDDLVATLQTLISLGAATLPDAEIKAAYAELGQIFWHVSQQGYDAVDAWRHVLEIDPGDAQAIEALLAIHTAQEEWRDVVEVLGRKAQLAQDPAEKVAIHLQAAAVWEQKIDEPDGARGPYESVLESDPMHEHAFTSLERLHAAAERWDELATLYVNRHDKLAEDGDSAAAVPFMVKAAKVYDQNLHDREQAFAAAQIAFEEDVANADAVKTLEQLTGQLGKWNDLLKATMDAYNAEPAGPRKTQLGLHVARWYGLELGHPEWAVPIYNQILTAEPTNLQALRALGELHRRGGQHQQLAKILQRAVGAATTSTERREQHLALGEVYEKHLRSPEQAIEQFNAALAIKTDDTDALKALARVHQGSESWDELVRVLRRTVEVTQDPAEVNELRLKVGEILEDRLNDFDGAVVEYGGVLQSDPANLSAMRGLERIYARLGRSQDLLHVLELQLDVVPTERERIKILGRLASMQEEEFVKPDLAIERFEQIVEIDPTHDNALRGLERLYRQTGRWNELVQTLERHLQATPERRDRVPIFVQMGRVYADEIRDLDHAEDAFLNVLQIDEQNTDALDALARIYEARGDHHRSLDMMEQLARLISADRTRAVELRFRVGRLAEQSLGDELRAVDQYQACLDLDPQYLPALEALRNIAVRREDWHDVARYLDREQAATAQPRMRARLLTELGRVTAHYLDDQPKAIWCYEEALRNDPDVEEAAWPLAMQYVSEARNAEAEPLVEMLLRKAGRRDPAEQLQLQLTMGRIAVAQGKTDRAVKAFTAAQALDRSNTEAIQSLAKAYFDKRDWENAFKNYQILLVHHKDDLEPEARAELYQKLGVVKREQGDRRRAINFLEKALEESPGYRPALESLIETYQAGNEWEQVIGYKTQLLEQESDESVRYAMLVEIGGLWQEKASNPMKAIQAYAGAVELRPKDHVLLHKLLVLYQETKQWSKIIETVQRISDLESDPLRKSRYAYTIATIYNSEIKNPDEALAFYNQALDLNPTELKPFAKINEILTAKRDFKNLERNFRKMLHRVTGKGNKDLEFNLLHNLGIIYRDRLGQDDAAIKAFIMASERKPEDVTEHKILAELYTRTGNAAEAVGRWRTIIENDMVNADALHAVYDLYYQGREYDKAWCVAATAAFLLRERAREDLRAFHEQYKPKRPLAPTGRLTEEHWIRLLFHANEDPVVGKIFASILGPLRKAKVQPLLRFGFTQKEQQDPATSSVALVKALGAAATALSLPLPAIFLKPQQPGGLGYVPSEPIASFSGGGLLSGLNPQELAFVAAKHMSYYRNEHYVRVPTMFPTVQEISAIMLGAIKLVKADQDVPPEALQTAQQLAPLVQADPIAMEGLRKVVRVFLDQGGAGNIKKWYQAVEFTASRAGFLMCGDLEVAKKMLSMEPGLPGDVSPAEKLKDVVLFSISEGYFSLREALGINFQSASGY